MYILEGLKRQGKRVSPDLESIKSYIDNETDRLIFEPGTNGDETKKIKQKKDFFKRRYGSKKDISFHYLMPINIHSISKKNDKYQFELSEGEIIDWENRTDSIEGDDDIFYPLFLSNGISNNQYKKVVIDNKEIINSNSFSDFLITPKAFEALEQNIGSNKFEASISTKFKLEKNIKNSLFDSFLHFIQEYKNNKDEFAAKTIYYIDFQSLKQSIFTGDIDLKTFLKDYFEEYFCDVLEEVEEEYNTEELGYNFFFYFFELFEHLYPQIFKMPIKNIKEKSFQEILRLKGKIFFETPNDQKKILGKQRVKGLDINSEHPELSVFELFLFRLILVGFSKQGQGNDCGYRFKVIEENNLKATIEKTFHYVFDQYGNISLNEVVIEDKKNDEKLKKHIIDKTLIYYDENFKNEKDSVIHAFLRKKFAIVLMKFFTGNKNQKELMWKKFDEKNYVFCANLLNDVVFKNLNTRILSFYNDKQGKEYVNTFNLRDLIYLLDVLKCADTMERLLVYTMKYEKIKEKLDAAKNGTPLNDKDFFYILGKISSLSIKGSRNEESLNKKFLNLKRTDDVMNSIHKRISSSISEIESIGFIKSLFNSLTENILDGNIPKTMNTEQKFCYLAGFLSEKKIKKNSEENIND